MNNPHQNYPIEEEKKIKETTVLKFFTQRVDSHGFTSAGGTRVNGIFDNTGKFYNEWEKDHIKNLPPGISVNRSAWDDGGADYYKFQMETTARISPEACPVIVCVQAEKYEKKWL